MPEGHTIHRLARGLRRTLGDAPVRATSPQGRFADGAALLDGERITRTEAWGKTLFVRFGAGPSARVLHVHLGLIGKFRDVGWPPPEPRDTIRLRLANEGGAWDLTGPSTCAVVTPVERRAIIATLGADPLRSRPDIAAARARMAGSSKPVGAVLLDQRVIAGLGNIYRAEILFLCGIHPMRAARDISDDEFDQIWAESVRLLRIGVRTGRIITTDPVEIGRPRSRMRLDDTLYVYHRDHCRRCGTELRTVELAGRPMQYCPTCQSNLPAPS
jgi:endonuclease-8